MVQILGDIHGNFQKLYMKAMAAKDTTIIQVGDFGVGFRSREKMTEEMTEINKRLAKNNNTLLVIRGNHDDPAYFDGNYNFSNIEFLPDYTVKNIEGKNYLFVGGAVSIDRCQRTAGVDYWLDERFVLDIDKLNSIEGNIDVVIAHSSPSFCPPVHFNELVWYFIAQDPSLHNVLLQERKDFETMYETLKAKGHTIEYWFNGHFHFTQEELINDTNFIVLGIDKFYEFNN
jgi:UDP-2,3-diacylglucosamine pyrophosphatase LpxH